MGDSCYIVKYQTYLGKVKVLKDKVTGGYKEFYKYENALKLKNWLQDKGYEAKVEIYRS